MRHALGVLGVLAAGVLLAVSAAMNYRFGYSLGKTELDGTIYGAASAAADCMKALVPFFFFAAIRNKMWSQAAASAVVWVVVTAYAMTSALGHAALNRSDSSGQRAVTAQAYKDLQTELKRTNDQLAWIPQHRPAATVEADIVGAKNRREWSWTNGCTLMNGKAQRDFCQQVHGFNAELASAQEAGKLNAKASDLARKIEQNVGGKATEADPQAAVLLALLKKFMPEATMEDIQTSMSIFVALLLEVGSGFGMYIAFSQWRLYDREAPAAPAMATIMTVTEPVAVTQPVAPPMITAAKAPRVASANDNKTAPKMMAPETDVERFYKERIDAQDGSSLTATGLYEDYCAWCEEQEKEPLALPTFGREFGELGVQKAKIAGRVRYIGIALRSGIHNEEDTKTTLPIVQAA
ncbi:MAG: hypothetical protein ABL904_03885 [Hyphomicrobiaceae bacterium]